MPHLRFYQILTLIVILALTVSCSEQTPRSLPPVTETDSPSTPAESVAEGPLPAAPTDTAPAPARPPKSPANPQGGSDASQNADIAIPEHSLDIILGRPTDTSITFSLLSPANNQTLLIAYSTQPENYTSQTEQIALQAGIPREVTLTGLMPDTQYYYSLDIGAQEGTFHTARAPGSSFTFTIQADSHLDSNTSLDAYQQTLANQRADNPDFVIDLGDTFMTDKFKPYTTAEPQYWAQRYYLNLLDAPLFLVLGNHDGEGAPKGKEGVQMSTWSAKLRTKLFPNPAPDGFYSGNSTPDPEVGPLQDYYAFTWGDALFIILDPYWFTPPLRNDSSLWTPTLGETQYKWLKTTLETSDAKWKFVFIHQLIGGYDKNGRGGVEVAPLYEWGGKNADGSDGFATNRPGWDMPIHQVLVANHVNAVFHGHDHLFVKQELDGIIYQEVPQPGAAHSNTNSAAEYGYLSGDVLGGPGHLRVTVAPDGVKVDYVRSEGGQVSYSYTIK